jgi:DNA-directed RNA polymerase subunit K/omega
LCPIPEEQGVPVIDRSKLPNAFEFVTVAGARARQLLDGCTPRVDTHGQTKIARVAQTEVLSGAVRRVEAPAPAPAEPPAQE